MIDEICCISTGRTGTNYICDLLDSVDNIMSLREIFSHNRCYVPPYVDKILKEKINLSSDNLIVNYTHNHIRRFMEILREIQSECDKQYMFYKIFITSYHISIEQLENRFFKENTNIGFLFITRDSIRTYVSLKKAQQLDIWDRIDTTNLKVTFEPEEFKRFCKTSNTLFNNIVSLCKKYNKSLLVLSYEEIFKIDTDIDRLRYIATKFDEAFNIKLNIPDTVKSRFFKQDSSDLKDAIINYEETVDFLKQ